MYTAELASVCVQDVSVHPAIIKEVRGLHMILWEECVH
jgi:hypothetical protein